MQISPRVSASINGCGVAVAVGAVLVIIAAILFPVFAKVHPTFNHESCQSNMKQIGIGFVQYLQDYDDQYPPERSNGVGWAGAIYPYIQSDRGFVCPDTENDRATVSYSMNSNLSKTKDAHGKPSADAITSVSLTVLAFETSNVPVKPSDEALHPYGPGAHSGSGNGMANGLQAGGIARNLSAGSAVIRYATGDIGGRRLGTSTEPPRHDSSSMYLAADGHVRLFRPEQVSSGETPRKAGPQTGGFATGTAASTDKLGENYRLTFSAR